MTDTDTDNCRRALEALHRAPQADVIARLAGKFPFTQAERERFAADGAALVSRIRADSRPRLMEAFLAEYGLSTREGVALMCLAEALLRVPDAETIDALIEDKIAPSSWGEHLGQSSSSLVNASTWGLMLTGRILRDEQEDGVAGTLRGVLKRLGEPLIRTAVRQAMRELGSEFVLGRDIDEAVGRAKNKEKHGFTYSYDMLGEAALTAADAQAYFQSYKAAIAALAPRCVHDNIADNPGISVKLSALHPRYEVKHHDRVCKELVKHTLALAKLARDANMGFNIDAEEADRLVLSLDVIEAVLRDPALAGWDGFGVVVQAYSKRTSAVIDWLYSLAASLDRRLMVRLVKGAYWDYEIKHAQVEGLSDFPVFTDKSATDVSYLCCARQLLGKTDRIYPQFATHNAHTVAAVLAMADDKNAFEFQRLHGMGESLHDMVKQDQGTRCRIYAPVGQHRDLLAYLVRRLLENGANSSFVNQIVDTRIDPTDVAADPFSALENSKPNPLLLYPSALYGAERPNSRGTDIHDAATRQRMLDAHAENAKLQYQVSPLLATDAQALAAEAIVNPARPDDSPGSVAEASDEDVRQALDAAQAWADTADAQSRCRTLQAAADLLEEHETEFFTLLAREAGKTWEDGIAEVREAVDFLRYYALQGLAEGAARPRGVITCISPWNFPLAIFCGQISAALAAGNAVLAKPAETTPATAWRAVQLLHQAGVPRSALQLLPGSGARVGNQLTGDPRVAGVCFTGSTRTAQAIHRNMAANLSPDALLIAETGGLNAMIVDSTALPEQAVRAIIESAFQSAGQRCSALRMLYLQEDTAQTVMTMLFGAMDELLIDDPLKLSTDIGPIISDSAAAEIRAYIDQAQAQGRVLKTLAAPAGGSFVAPTVIRVNGIADLEREIFGPVLHIATFKAGQIDQLIDDINTSGYGLTFALQSRIDDRVNHLSQRIRAGNLYINRNQIGAIVGSQPFGGEGLSGTGPKAGGPDYVRQFYATSRVTQAKVEGRSVTAEEVQKALDALPQAVQKPLSQEIMPGPTGESNQLSRYPRGKVLCLGPDLTSAREQAQIAAQHACLALIVCPGAGSSEGIDGFLPRGLLTSLQGTEVVALWSENDDCREARRALAAREGALIPLATGPQSLATRCVCERHVCIDTTAAGGNASLLAAGS
ncbi:bifunctional proline dehydrogenase/L-glutamate gamma-semialdehyde dehydrogenase PutA [Granulosicoccaceae sp. 1_MG-2023]|nr:bifunctional proline dehydrogenase/L-glutamate gamma-semialdehyde dehydrogenase PutA [Granulosicoccaceae sp. 1_MG-2023]